MAKLSKRRAFIFGCLGIAGLSAWRYRIPQVGTFLAAAAVRKKLTSDPVANFRELASQWTSLKPTRNYFPSLSRGMITYHPWYHNFQPSLAATCLAKTAELGAGWIRIDVRWKDLIPDGRRVDEDAWKWYESYLRAANNWYALRPLIVLSNPPNGVLQYDINSRLAAWDRFVDEVAQRAGNLCGMYQLLNEPNNRVYRIFSPEATSMAILSGAKIIRHHNPDARITINVLAGLWRWQSDLQEILQKCISAVDIVGLDFYPGTWTVSSKSNSSQWNQFADSIAPSRDTRGSPLYGRAVAIIETGFSTNVRRWRSEDHQASYFRMLEDTIKHLDAKIGGRGLALVGIHELCDGDTHTFLDPEAHFGLLTSDTLRRKAAFDVVARIFSATDNNSSILEAGAKKNT
jgi:hypothetical protein